MNLVSPIPGIVKEPAFPEAEYRTRLARLWDVMREAGLDAMLVHHPASVFYFAGNENLHVYDNECVVAPLGGEPTLVVPRIDETRACLTAWTDRIASVTSDEDAPDVLAGVLREAGVDRGRIGVEKRVARAAGLVRPRLRGAGEDPARGDAGRRVRRAGAGEARQVRA